MRHIELDELYDQHGGKFRFSVMLQKRVQQLVNGERRLIKVNADNPIDVALAEVQAGKVWLEDNELKTASE